MADQVILMRDGRVEQDSAPDVLYANPATAFAARFVGTPPMNVLRLASGLRGVVLDGARVDARAICQGDPAAVELGIRPEHIRLVALAGATPLRGSSAAAGDVGDEEMSADATIETCEYFGSDTILGCRTGTQAVAVRSPGKQALEVGTPVRLTWSRASQHFFSTASGQAALPVS